MDLIYTDSNRVDQGVLGAYTFDLSFGADENDFELTMGGGEPVLNDNAFVYIEGTEYGGIVDGKQGTTDTDTITYRGRTWHGVLNSKIIQPDSGEDYFTVSGDANEILSTLIDRLGLGKLFVVDPDASGITIANYRFTRYCRAYDGLLDMLKDHSAKLHMVWEGRVVRLKAVPIVDYTSDAIDGDVATLDIQQYWNKVNHLICLGQGELSEREVIHLYVDQFGRIGDVQYFTGLEEWAETYINTNSESSADLRKDGIKRLKELRGNDVAEMALSEDLELIYDVGDIVGTKDMASGMGVAEAVTQKIVKINNGAIRTEYKTGGD